VDVQSLPIDGTLLWRLFSYAQYNTRQEGHKSYHEDRLAGSIAQLETTLHCIEEAYFAFQMKF
jgi:hypothetical protein